VGFVDKAANQPNKLEDDHGGLLFEADVHGFAVTLLRTLLAE
jgi:hypothetical protein